MKNVTAALSRALGFVLPSPCLGCGDEVQGRGPGLGLCRSCFGKLAAAGEGCRGCGRSLLLAGEDSLCSHCRRDPPPFRSLETAWLYRPPFDAVIHGLKFRRLDYLGEDLAAGLAQALQRNLGPGLRGCDVVVPVPLHWMRRLRRGFDQAECIARPLAQRLGLPFSGCLRRRRATRARAKLDRRQRTDRPIPFSLRRRDEIEGRRVLLVDDVVTTGSTLRAAARALRKGGALTVIAATAGRTEITADGAAAELRPPGASKRNFFPSDFV